MISKNSIAVLGLCRGKPGDKAIVKLDSIFKYQLIHMRTVAQSDENLNDAKTFGNTQSLTDHNLAMDSASRRCLLLWESFARSRAHRTPSSV